MNTAYRNAIADHGGTLITHIALADGSGTELSGGTPAYSRKAVSWTAAVDGVIRPTVDLNFDIPAGSTVAKWVAYAADGTTVYNIGDLTSEVYSGQGEYKLLAASSGITHAAA